MSKAVLQPFEQYQKSRVTFVQTVAELATRPQNIEALQSAGVMSLLRPLLLDNVPSISQSAALALGRLANMNEELAESVVNNEILPQLVMSLNEQNVTSLSLSDSTRRQLHLSYGLLPSTPPSWLRQSSTLGPLKPWWYASRSSIQPSNKLRLGPSHTSLSTPQNSQWPLLKWVQFHFWSCVCRSLSPLSSALLLRLSVRYANTPLNWLSSWSMLVQFPSSLSSSTIKMLSSRGKSAHAWPTSLATPLISQKS